MSAIGALLVDDEPPARRGLRQLLASHPDIYVVGECRDGREALRALDELRPDLVFLDIQMPELDGFEVVRAHGVERMPPVVFVTAYEEPAVRAFEVHALDYLVKPIERARFDLAIARFREARELRSARDLARNGVRVVTIAPGLIETPLFANLDPKAVESLVANTVYPTRLGKPEEYAKMVLHIAENLLLNGSVIRLDGAVRLGVK